MVVGGRRPTVLSGVGATDLSGAIDRVSGGWRVGKLGFRLGTRGRGRGAGGSVLYGLVEGGEGVRGLDR